MSWEDQRIRIRRMLRDPDGNIWSDAFLLALYNDEQHSIQNAVGAYQDIRVVRMPPMFYTSFMFDFEYAHTDSSSGEVWQIFYYDDNKGSVYNHFWERQHFEELTPTTSAVGTNYTQPWEGLSDLITPAEPPPIKLPADFNKMLFIAYDKDPLKPISKREVEDMDSSWRTRQGKPMYYWRDEEFSNRIYLYPIPDSITFTDTETDGEGDPDTSEYGTTTIDVDNNLIVVFDKNLSELSNDYDSPSWAEFLHKYLEYGVTSRAYHADTDGYIPSLGEYWEMRKNFGINAIRRYMQLKKADREYRLRPHVGEPIRSRKHPRLPSDYPVTYP